MTQKRWQCLACQREWVYATNWEAAQGCPMCKVQTIEQVTYDAAFPGADIGTRAEDLPCIPAPSVPPPPLEREGMVIAENQTLALSSPEFG